MSLPSAEALYQVIEETWPPAARRRLAGWMIREGRGGGQRVSATTQESDRLPDIGVAEAAMDALGQPRLFMIRQGEAALDRALEGRGYARHDPVVLYACPTDTLTAEPVPPVSAFALWPPLQVMRDVWAEGGIGPGRLAVMERARGPKTAILSRQNDRVAGVAFVAIHQRIAMIHAVEVTPALRRKGAGINIMRAAAHWAQERGAAHVSLLVRDANLAANRLYEKLSMAVVGKYHYRLKKD